MKYDPLKSFGYPVLKPLEAGQDRKTADYMNAGFQPSFGFDICDGDPSKFVVSYDFSGLSLSALKDAIDRGQAKYLVRLECRSTFHSSTRFVSVEGAFDIEGNLLRDWVEIKGFVVAVCECNISSDQINPEFEYTTFTAEEGAVLAWAPPTTYSVEKDFYRNIRSIFEYQEDEKLKDGQFHADLDNDSGYVMIYANARQIGFLRKGEATENMRIHLLNGVFFPVVVQMAVMLRDHKEQALSKRWGQIVVAKCAAKNIDYSRNPYLTATELLDRPLKMLNKILAD